MYSYGVFFKPIAADFHWSRATTSLVASIGAAEVGLLGIVAGFLSDRFGPQIVVAFCAFLLGLSHLLTSQIHALWQFLLFYGFIRGLGMSGAYSPILSTIPRWFDKKRGLTLGIVVAGIGLGTMIFLPVTAYLVSAYQWRTAFIIVAIIIWAIVLPSALLLRRHPREMGLSPYGKTAIPSSATEKLSSAAPKEEHAMTTRQAMRTPSLWILFSIFALYAFGLGMIMVHMINYATDIKISSTTAALFVSVIGGTSVLGRIVMGGISDKMGIRNTMIISLVLMIVPMFFFAVTKSVVGLFVLSAFFGFGYGGMVPQFPSAAGQIFGTKSLGTIFGLITLGSTIGNGTGPLIAGYLYDTTHSYQLAFSLGAVALIVGLILTFFVRYPKANYT